jgi:sulfatase modifying factor 1
MFRVKLAGLALLSLSGLSCGASDPASSQTPPPSVPTPPAPSVVPVAASVSASATESAQPPVASATASLPEPVPPTACPEDMVLIDGDYCTNLEVKCKSSHYAKANKKTICHEFVQPTKCIGNKVKKRYCIDRYEFPNKKGQNPEVMNDFPHAQKKCAALGKRVCTETEWTMACEGPEYKPYPYGYKRDPSKCNGDKPYKFPSKQENGLLLTHSKNEEKAAAEIKRLWDGVPSGSQPDCVSDYGVFDMPGNADELAASEGNKVQYGSMKMTGGKIETLRAADKFDNVTTGGPWVDGVRNQCRPKIYTHNEGFSYYYLSFRCCAETDGKPTDPRAPRQIKRGEKWKD